MQSRFGLLPRMMVKLCVHIAGSCMAGLGEACSHIAALLFAAQTNTELQGQFACTSLPCSWLPSSFRTVPFAEIAKIDFSSASQKRKRLMKNGEADGSSASDELQQQMKKSSIVSKPSEEDKHAFLRNCHNLVVVLLFCH